MSHSNISHQSLRTPKSEKLGYGLLFSLLSVLTSLSATAGNAGTGAGKAPKVVINILVDQLRSDYLQAFMPLYGHDGLLRLMNEGRVYSQAEHPMANPDLASAAATIASGTSPCDHGIVGMKWLNRATLRPIFCIDDPEQKGVGTQSAFSPRFVQVSTIGDELKVATEGAAKVYAIAPTPEAAILGGAHAADAVAWIDDQTGRWCSSSYYGHSLPSWIAARNTESTAVACEQTTWQPSNELVGNFSYFLSQGMRKPFAHKFKGPNRIASFKTSGLVNQEVAELAALCIEKTPIGQDAITDYLSITFYAGNFEHKPANQAPMELQDTYVRLDAAIAKLIGSVSQKIGLEHALFVLTSTGSADEEDGQLSKFRIPTGTIDIKRTAALLNMYLTAIYGQGTYVEATFGTQLYLNHKLIENKQLNLSELLARSQDFLLQLSGVRDVYTSQRLLQGAWTPGISRIRNGYHIQHSGDIMIEVAPGWHYTNEDTNERRLVRASYVPFPIIFFGAGVGVHHDETPVGTDYIAPTLAGAMRIRAPNACNQKPIAIYQPKTHNTK